MLVSCWIGLSSVNYYNARGREAKDERGLSISADIAYRLLLECSRRQDLDFGRTVQCFILQNGLHSVPLVADHVIRFFANCGRLIEANEAFAGVVRPSLCPWNAVIDAHVKLGKCKITLALFYMIQQEGRTPNRFTFPSILKTCSRSGALEHGRWIHVCIYESGPPSDTVVANALVDMYAKCGSLKEASRVFDRLHNRDVISWNALISGFSQHSSACLALKYFHNMLQQGIIPDKITFLSILRACGSLGFVMQGRCIHEKVFNYSLQSDILIGNTLVFMYGKCGSLDEACSVFNKLSNRDVVSWNAMIAGYAQHGKGNLALNCYRNMFLKPTELEGTKPDRITFLAALKACGNLGAIQQGRYIHEQIAQKDLEFDILMGSTIVDMYVKCGSLKEAHRVFERLPHRNVVSWGAMLAGYGQLGETRLAVQCFKDMQCNGIEPDGVSFLNVLTSLNQAGLIDEAHWYFRTMSEYYSIETNDLHVTCMIDLLGHAGCFREVQNLLECIRNPDICLLILLLNACRMHCNVELGRLYFASIVC